MKACCESSASVYRTQLAEKDAQLQAAAAETERLKESVQGLAAEISAQETERTD